MTLADVEYTIVENALIARFRGEIDLSNAGAITQAVAQATPNDLEGVVLDLTGIQYLDSAGIHMIYRLREDLSTRGQQLAVVLGADSPVHDALGLAGVKGMVEVVGTVDEALAVLDKHEVDPLLPNQ